MEYIGIFQVQGYPVPCSWLQFSVHLGGQQCGSNYNARFQYVSIQKSDSRTTQSHLEENPTGVGHPLHLNKYDIYTDRTTYDRWYGYDQQPYCYPGVMVNLDLAIVTGTEPTLYGEVESSCWSDATAFERLDQVSARVLCYTDKCFSIYAKGDVIFF